LSNLGITLLPLACSADRDTGPDDQECGRQPLSQTVDVERLRANNRHDWRQHHVITIVVEPHGMDHGHMQHAECDNEVQHIDSSDAAPRRLRVIRSIDAPGLPRSVEFCNTIGP
jgi:hypothetical protein